MPEEPVVIADLEVTEEVKIYGADGGRRLGPCYQCLSATTPFPTPGVCFVTGAFTAGSPVPFGDQFVPDPSIRACKPIRMFGSPMPFGDQFVPDP